MSMMRKELILFFLLLMTFAKIFSIGRKDKVLDWPLGRKEKSERESERRIIRKMKQICLFLLISMMIE